MSFPVFDRRGLRFAPLAERRNKVVFPGDSVSPEAAPRALSARAGDAIRDTAERITAARERGRPVICAFGAHTIKNGLGPVLSRLIEQGWITHLATNGAGVIHDWELAFLGQTGEDVRANIARGEFGMWEETGRILNLALRVGARKGQGCGQSIGALIEEEGLEIPSAAELHAEAARLLAEEPEKAAAAADLLGAVQEFGIPPGRMHVPHPFRHSSLLASAHRSGVSFTAHPGIGQDIIHAHPMASGAAIGRAALIDFLRFAEAVSRLEGGVYLSVGSAVMSPMIFEKALSMGQNMARRKGSAIRTHTIVVVDIAESSWDWEKNGEPPADNAAYYLRYCKSFARMGGTLRSIAADNRDFFLSLLHSLPLS